MKSLGILLVCLSLVGQNVVGTFPGGMGLFTLPGMGGSASAGAEVSATGSASASGSGSGSESAIAQFQKLFKFPNPIFPSSGAGAGVGVGAGAGAGAGGQKQLGLPMGLPDMTSPEAQKCMQSFHSPGMTTCIQDLGNTFQTQKIALSPACCTFLRQMDSSCEPVIHFRNPFLQSCLEKHCTGAAAATGGDASASAGADASSTTSAAASGFSDETGPGGPGAAAGAAVFGAGAPTSFS